VNSNKLKAIMTKVITEAREKVEYEGHINVSLRHSEHMGHYHWNNAGLAFTSSHLIALNRDFCELNLTYHYDTVVKVAMHEIIHLKLPVEIIHGPQFKEECVKYGFHPDAWIPGTFVDNWWKREVHGRTPSKVPKNINFRVI
jgi:hypothetical protein